MSFQATSRNIHLEGTVLKAECRDWDGNWKSSSIDLDTILGSVDGSFCTPGSSFSHSASSIRIAAAVMLTADLKSKSGDRKTRTLDLNLCIANKNGDLKYEKPRESLLNCGSCYKLEGSILHGLCMGYDGVAYHTTIDLNEYYGNDNGTLVSGSSHFYNTSRNVSLSTSSSAVTIHAECKGNHWPSGDFWGNNDVDLAVCVLIHGGAFVFEKHDGPFDRDGWFAKFFERVPFAGFIVAAVQAIAGNEDHALRALALCANSTIVCTGIIIGSIVGGPLGGAIGAGLSTPIAILVESEIKNTITDSRLKAEFQEATIGRYIYETLRNTIAAGAAGYLASFLAQQAGTITAEALGNVAGQFATRTTSLSEVGAYALLKKVADALVNGQLPKEWIVAEEKVKKLQ